MYFLTFYLAYLLAFYLTYYLASYLTYLLGSSQVEVQRCTLSWAGPRLRSSSTHWARKIPGWGPAVLTELGGSQVEGHWARKVPGWCPAVPSALRPLQLWSSSAHCARKLGEEIGKELARPQPAVEVQQCTLRAEFGEEIGDELARPKPAVEVQ